MLGLSKEEGDFCKIQKTWYIFGVQQLGPIVYRWTFLRKVSLGRDPSGTPEHDGARQGREQSQ